MQKLLLRKQQNFFPGAKTENTQRGEKPCRSGAMPGKRSIGPILFFVAAPFFLVSSDFSKRFPTLSSASNHISCLSHYFLVLTMLAFLRSVPPTRHSTRSVWNLPMKEPSDNRQTALNHAFDVKRVEAIMFGFFSPVGVCCYIHTYVRHKINVFLKASYKTLQASKNTSRVPIRTQF
jgi:hypothetical protein